MVELGNGFQIFILIYFLFLSFSRPHMWREKMSHMHLAVIIVLLSIPKCTHTCTYSLLGGWGENGLSLNLISLSPSGAKEFLSYSHTNFSTPLLLHLSFILSFFALKHEFGHVFVLDFFLILVFILQMYSRTLANIWIPHTFDPKAQINLFCQCRRATNINYLFTVMGL